MLHLFQTYGTLLGMQEWDSQAFHFINSSMSNDFFDQVMPVVTDLHKNSVFMTWILPPLVLYWFYRQRKRAVVILLGLGLCVGAVDSYCYRILKPHFQRPRPPVAEKVVQLRVDRYAGHSFPSNHAANNFAAAVFLSNCYPGFRLAFISVAGLIAFSRVYVGVHYPGDVLAGALLGVLFGLFFFKFWSIILGMVGRRWPALALPKLKNVTQRR